MLRPEIICFACKKGSAAHTQYVMDSNGVVVSGGECVALRRDYEPYSYRLTQRRILDANAERELTR